MSVHNNKMLLAATAVLLVSALLVSGCAPLSQAAPASAGETPMRTITVVGRGEVKARPDTANATIGVDVSAVTVSEAMEEAKARMSAILAALKALGIAPRPLGLYLDRWMVRFRKHGRFDTRASA